MLAGGPSARAFGLQSGRFNRTRGVIGPHFESRKSPKRIRPVCGGISIEVAQMRLGRVIIYWKVLLNVRAAKHTRRKLGGLGKIGAPRENILAARTCTYTDIYKRRHHKLQSDAGQQHSPHHDCRLGRPPRDLYLSRIQTWVDLHLPCEVLTLPKCVP